MREGFYITLTKLDGERVFIFVSNMESVVDKDGGSAITMTSGDVIEVKETFDFIIKQSERYGVIKKGMV